MSITSFTLIARKAIALLMERKTGLEPATYSLEGYRSTN